jgi:glycosyltransferase involved in cell wall biosynthesis
MNPFEKQSNSKMENSVSVSIIIPVFNDSERLKTCLMALNKQSYPKENYRVIVVDNASEENIKEIVDEFSCAEYLYESCPGSYAARNKGISAAKGEVLGFTDSDCIPEVDWIKKGVDKLLSMSNCGLVVGSIELFFKNSEHPTSVELYEKMTAFKQRRNVEINHWGATANVFTFMSVIEKVGLFNDTLQSGGDIDWGQRVFAAGYLQLYADDCRVLHPARHSFDQLSKKMVRVAKGRHDRLKKIHETPYYKPGFKDDLISSVSRALRPPVKSAVNIFFNRELKGTWQKIQVIYILVLVRYISAWTKVRLTLGFWKDQNT